MRAGGRQERQVLRMHGVRDGRAQEQRLLTVHLRAVGPGSPAPTCSAAHRVLSSESHWAKDWTVTSASTGTFCAMAQAGESPRAQAGAAPGQSAEPTDPLFEVTGI